MVAINRSVAVAGDEDIALVTIEPPPVGSLPRRLREGLWTGLEETLAADEVRAIVLLWGDGSRDEEAPSANGAASEDRAPSEDESAGERGFEAGGPSLDAIIERIEASGKPIVAALRGTVLGSALSLGLACHHRVAMPRTRLGFPQVSLGLIPGHGATQRLPRLVGVRRALDMILGAEALGAASAQVVGLVDEVAVGDPALAAMRIARAAAEPHRPLRPLRERTDRLGVAGEAPPLFWEARRRHEERLGRSKAFEGALQAVRAAVELPFDEGVAREAGILAALQAEDGPRPDAADMPESGG